MTVITVDACDKTALGPFLMRFDGRFSLLGMSISPAFDRRIVVIPPRATRLYDAREWHDALVVVEQGAIELECSLGTEYHFRSGDVLFLGGLPLCALHNRGREPAVLGAVFRQAHGVEPEPVLRT